MTKVLYVGDPHATADALAELEALIDYIDAVASREAVDAVCFLGDQYHTHSVLHLAVIAFWQRAFARLASRHMVIALVGNHDRSGVAGATEHSMMIHEGVIRVVDKPTMINGVLYIPYMADGAAFIQACIDNRAAFPHPVVCHQTFVGAQFENGFYAPGGINPDDIPQKTIISGHVHTRQRLGDRVFYVGAPRWRTVSDANIDRFLHVIEHSGDDYTVKEYPTSVVCSPIVLLEDNPETPAVLPGGNARVTVDVRGPRDYVQARKLELEAAGVRVRAFVEEERVARARESDGLPKALQGFLETFVAKNGTPASELEKMAEERISWMRRS